MVVMPTTINGDVYIHPTKGIIGTSWRGEEAVPLLVAPRWTVARLEAKPPAGWTYDPIDDTGLAYLGWGLAPADSVDGLSTYVVMVTLRAGRLIAAPEYLTNDLSSLLAAVAPVAELLAILAEIEP